VSARVPVYRPETFGDDILLAARDLLGWAQEYADEDLDQGGAEATRGLRELHQEAETQLADLSHEPDGDDDPVRSVRAAVALLGFAAADDPAGPWAELAAELERRMWERGPRLVFGHGASPTAVS
jgi:hypothetical protein